MQVQARAKINLALDVVERMDNGYHSLGMIMAPISIYDEIEKVIVTWLNVKV